MKSAIEILAIEEGYREVPYRDTEGLWTVGYGRCLSRVGLGRFTRSDFDPDFPLDHVESLVSFHLRDAGDRPAIEVWKADLEKSVQNIKKALSLDVRLNYNDLPETTQLVLILLSYQLGIAGLFGFKKMVAAINKSKFGLAAFELVDSRYSEQTRGRAFRVAKMLASQEYLS